MASTLRAITSDGLKGMNAINMETFKDKEFYRENQRSLIILGVCLFLLVWATISFLVAVSSISHVSVTANTAGGNIYYNGTYSYSSAF